MAAPALALTWKRSATSTAAGAPWRSALGVRTGSISNDDLDAGVGAQPICEDLCSTVVEQINRPVRFKIEEQRSIPALCLSERDVIDTQNSRTALVVFVGKAMQQVNQRVGADGYTGFARQPSATLAASL